MLRKTLFGQLLVVMWLVTNVAYANIVITGTRVVYNSTAREVTVRMDNPGKTPALLQVWVDRGDEKSTPNTTDAPFLVMPPISKVDPGKSQTIRITYTGEPLPQDKESVFWLNVLDVPPMPNPKEIGSQNYMQIAIRSRIKLFYRPKGLPSTPDEAADKITWQLIPQGKHFALRGSNAGAYHVSFNKAEIRTAERVYQSDSGLMIAPGESTDFALKGMTKFPQGLANIHYDTINDYGAVVPHTTPLNP